MTVPANVAAGPELREQPTLRWRPIIDRIDPRIGAERHWPLLAAALDRAEAVGYGVAANLPRLARDVPLTGSRRAVDLHVRLVLECPAAMLPAGAPPQHPGFSTRLGFIHRSAAPPPEPALPAHARTSPFRHNPKEAIMITSTDTTEPITTAAGLLRTVATTSQDIDDRARLHCLSAVTHLQAAGAASTLGAAKDEQPPNHAVHRALKLLAALPFDQFSRTEILEAASDARHALLRLG